MLERNSYAEFVLGTYKALLVDCALQYPVLAREFDRDLHRLSSAIKQHGVKFTLDIMPKFRKHFDTCLSNQRLTPSNLTNFGTIRRREPIPRLFRGLVLRVFDRHGALQLNPDVKAIRLIRQLLGVVRKMRMDSSRKDTCRVVSEFFEIDQETDLGNLNWSSEDLFVTEGVLELSFRDSENTLLVDERLRLTPPPSQASCVTPELLDYVQRTADLISSQLGIFDPYTWRLRHGPGAVADQRFGSYKYDFDYWSDRLSIAFPRDVFAYANPSFSYEDRELKKLLAGCEKSLPAKLITVPKTITGPRLIAAEPVAHQWCQQSIKDYFYNRVSDTPIRNLIDFRRQDLNGKLALSASHSGSHATIDLSSASDRVSCWHVERLFRRLPCLLTALWATRSNSVKQDIDRTIPKEFPLRKYSTMGNATIFPVQSLFFGALAFATYCYVRKLPVSLRTMRIMGRQQVRVFGDDIIVPNDCAGQLVELLDALKLKVNTSKTFQTGLFRESCGIDAYGGHDVTTVSILDVPRRAGPGSIVSSVDVHHNLCEAGYMVTAAYLQKTASRVVSNQVPYVKHGSGRFGWSDLFGCTETRTRVRFDEHLQKVFVRALCPYTVEKRNKPENNPGLLQFFTEAAKVVTTATSSLGYLAQRPQVKLSLRWAPAY